MIIKISLKFQCLFQWYTDYRSSWSNHVEKQTSASLASYLDAHNTYVQHLHGTNGMIDQYYVVDLPHLLQVTLYSLHRLICTKHIGTVRTAAPGGDEKNIPICHYKRSYDKQSMVCVDFGPYNAHDPTFYNITQHRFKTLDLGQ